MFQQSEIVSLLMGAALASIMYAGVRRIEFAGKQVLTVGLSALLAAYTFTVVETVVLPDLFNLLEHASLAASGVAFAIGLNQFARAEQRAKAGS